MGELRDDIMEKCPIGFKDELKKFINTIEDVVNSAKNEIDIDNIADICDIETGFDIISKLAADLY